MIDDPELLALTEKKRAEALELLGSNHLTHPANRVAYKPAKLSLLQQFVMERRNECKAW